MSWGYANSNLFIQCKSEEQAKELEKRFKEEDPGQNLFYLWQGANDKNRWDLDLTDGDIPDSFDDDVLALNKWLKENFDLKLEGYWIYDGDDLWRCEVHDDKVVDGNLSWLAGYTVAQIQELKQMAEEKFKEETEVKYA